VIVYVLVISKVTARLREDQCQRTVRIIRPHGTLPQGLVTYLLLLLLFVVVSIDTYTDMLVCELNVYSVCVP